MVALYRPGPMDLIPDFELDRALTSQRLLSLYDRMKGERYALVKLSYTPEGGRLLVDGRSVTTMARKYLPFGTHKLTYARPGHASADAILELDDQLAAGQISHEAYQQRRNQLKEELKGRL